MMAAFTVETYSCFRIAVIMIYMLTDCMLIVTKLSILLKLRKLVEDFDHRLFHVFFV